ncbi:hypothetical protein BDR26DRAFT_1002445 [Obelidium mucronatum]|nr:hypothetical protein BDR26DRAFT_1002445 [Obelidium mucronatum]
MNPKNRRPRIASFGSVSSASSASSSASSQCGCDCGVADGGGGEWLAVSQQCAAHWPRRTNSAEAVAAKNAAGVKPILRSASGVFRGSPSSPALFDLARSQKQDRLKRISFSSESLLLFSNEDSPRAVANESVYAKTITPAQTNNDRDLFEEDDEDETTAVNSNSSISNQAPTWSILSTTTPSPLAPIMQNIKLNSIAFESIRIITTQPSDSIVKLDLTALVQNLHFEKRISALFTTNSWKSCHSSSFGMYIGCVAVPSHNGDPGVDRFRIEIECDTSSGAPVVGTNMDTIVNIEFALKCVMGGVETWDNRGGMNHLVMLKSQHSTANSRQASPILYGTVKKSPSALDLESEMMRKRRASVVALKVAAVVADEAKRIDEEFSLGRRRSLEESVAVEEAIASSRAEARARVGQSTPSAPTPPIVKPVPVVAAPKPISSLLSSAPVSVVAAASAPIIEELSEKELEYASRIARPTSPLTTIHPLKRVGSINNLSISEPAGLNRPASPNPNYSLPSSPSLIKSELVRPASPLACNPKALINNNDTARAQSPASAKVQEVKRPIATATHSIAQPIGMISTRQQPLPTTPPSSPIISSSNPSYSNIIVPKPTHPNTPSRVAVLNAASGRLTARLDQDGDYAPLTTPPSTPHHMYSNVSSLYASGKSFGSHHHHHYSYEQSLSSSPHY